MNSFWAPYFHFGIVCKLCALNILIFMIRNSVKSEYYNDSILRKGSGERLGDIFIEIRPHV
jgi:hypothetical protein